MGVGSPARFTVKALTQPPTEGLPMKHTTEDLLLACQVREIASRLRASETPIKVTNEERLMWQEENPLMGFVPRALTHIEDVATVIKTIRQSRAA